MIQVQLWSLGQICMCFCHLFGKLSFRWEKKIKMNLYLFRNKTTLVSLD